MAKVFLLLLSAFLFGMVSTVPPVFAETRNNELVILPGDEVIFRDYFGFGETVRIEGTINGDAYVGGKNVVVEGNINGDLIGGGGTVTVLGNVRDNVRVAGGQVTIAGQVGRNITAAAGSLQIPSSATIGGSLVATGGNIDVYAPIGGDVRVRGGSVTIGNTVDGDLRAGVGQLSLTSNAKINGNLEYSSEKTATIPTGATIAGKVAYSQPKHATKENAEKVGKEITAFAIGMQGVGLLVAFVIGLLFMHFFPMFMQRSADTVRSATGTSFLVGILTFLVTPIILILFLITIIGIPLGLILFLGFSLLIYLAKIPVALAVGQRILRRNGKTNPGASSLFVGLLLYYVFMLIPFVGLILWPLVTVIGIGALLIEKKRVYTMLRAKKSI